MLFDPKRKFRTGDDAPGSIPLSIHPIRCRTVNRIPPPVSLRLDSEFREFKTFRPWCKAKYRNTAMTAAMSRAAARNIESKMLG
jgi:hypothetical protein